MIYVMIILLVIVGILDIVFGIIDLKNKKRKSGLFAILLGITLFISAVDNYNRNFKDNTPSSTIINNYYIGEI